MSNFGTANKKCEKEVGASLMDQAWERGGSLDTIFQVLVI